MATAAIPTTTGSAPSEDTHLKHGELSLFDSVMIATASVAPAYSLAATIGLLVVAVGIASPATILVSFVPVLFIALAYYYMNRQDPNCGASYSWLARTVNPYVGWFNGWVQTAASVLFCIAAPVLAGTNTMALLQSLGWVSADVASNTAVVAVVSLAWLVLVTVMVVRGIRMTANFQWIMVAIEYVLVLGFSIAGLLKVAASHPAGSRPVDFNWLNPFSIQGLEGLAAGAVLGVFFFWGWDTAANLNEETKDADETPGLAGIASMFILLLVFLVASVAMQSLLPADTIGKQGGNALFYFAEQIAPAPISYLMVLAVLASTVATTQTTLLPATRLTFSMARDRVFPAPFGHVHPVWQTPWVGTLIVGGIAAAGILLTSFSSSVNSTFQTMISNIGVLVALYYGLTGLACAWAFRKMLTQSPVFLFLAGILPAIGGVFLLWIAYEVVAQAGLKTSLPVLIVVIAGIPLVFLARVMTKSDFFGIKAIAYTKENTTKVVPTTEAAPAPAG